MNDLARMDLHLSEGYQQNTPNPLGKRAIRILKGTADFADRYVADHNELVQLLDIMRSMNCAIAFTTGVWDLIHIGHAEYIQAGKREALKLCSDAEHLIMVVGVDTDELVRSRKGPSRPIVSMDERCRIIGHLRAADIIVPQYEPDSLFKVVKHDVRIVSKSTKDLPGLDGIKKYCQHLVHLEPQSDTSTTARVRQLAVDGKLEMMKALRPRVVKLLEEMEHVLGSEEK
jgi:cytidyltransferase-like protein